MKIKSEEFKPVIVSLQKAFKGEPARKAHTEVPKAPVLPQQDKKLCVENICTGLPVLSVEVRGQ